MSAPANRPSVEVAIEDLVCDPAAQPRAEPDPRLTTEYTAALLDGDLFPPIVVFGRGKPLWVADGFHRVAAHQDAGMTVIAADVRDGDLRDAILYSVGANAAHGLRRTNADKQRAVLTLLNDPEWSKWSDREIARRCAVDHKTVSSLRPPVTGEIPGDEVRTFVDRYGNPSHMRVAAIGKARPEMPVIAGKRAERRPRPDAAGLQEVVGVGFASTITGLSDRNVKLLAKEGVIDGAEKEGGVWSFPTASLVALVEQSKAAEPADTPVAEVPHQHDWSQGTTLLTLADLITSFDGLPPPAAALSALRADPGAFPSLETIRAAGAWLAEFVAGFPAVHAVREARAAEMEKVLADAVA